MDKAKILFLSANPINQVRLDWGAEYRQIMESVRIAGNRLELVPALGVRREDWLTELNMRRFEINAVHFSGHGSSNGMLILLGPDNLTRLADPQILKSILSQFKETIHLVVLNACYSLSQAEEIVKEIDCVVAMKGKIRDEAAIAFAARFYQALGTGHSVGQAFRQGEIELMEKEFQENKDVPQLLERPGIKAAEIFLIDSPQQQVPARPSTSAADVSTKTPETASLPSPNSKRNPISIVCIDAPGEEKYRKNLESHLRTMTRDGHVTIFSRASILAGSPEIETMQKKMRAAHLILLIVTPNLMSSDKIYNHQLKLALELYKGGTRIIPIIAERAIGWERGEFKVFEQVSLPKDGKPISPQKRVNPYPEIAEEIISVIEHLEGKNELY